MTYEEAKNNIEDNLDAGDVNNLGVEALEIALRALEKQIPRKLVLTEFYLVCPKCKHIISSKNCKKTDTKHCWVCGQALDWSEEE